MKVKKFNKSLNKPQVGDYVICYESGVEPEEELQLFLSENIGKIFFIKEGSTRFPYFVQYQDIPYNCKPEFEDFLADRKDIRNFSRDEIIEFSDNQQDLEDKIIAKKYNLWVIINFVKQIYSVIVAPNFNLSSVPTPNIILTFFQHFTLNNNPKFANKISFW